MLFALQWILPNFFPKWMHLFTLSPVLYEHSSCSTCLPQLILSMWVFFLKATLLYACLSSLLKLVLEKSRSKTLSKQTALYYVRLSFGRYRTDKVQRHIQTPIIINPGNKGITSVFSINHWKFSEKTFILSFTILPVRLWINILLVYFSMHP